MVLYRRDATPGATWFVTFTQHVAWVERSDTQGTFSRVSLRSIRATFEGCSSARDCSNGAVPP